MEERLGREIDGSELILYTLTNGNGVRAEICNLGGILVSLHVPDRLRRLEDVVVGYDLERLIKDNDSYFGAIIGRYGNRTPRAFGSLVEPSL